MFPIRVKNLVVMPKDRPILNGVNLTLDGDGISVILGPNGAGKSVLMRTLAGLNEFHGGEIDWRGEQAPEQRIAFVFQHPMMLRSSVCHNVTLGLKSLPLSKAEKQQRVFEVLEQVGLAHRTNESARLLSGGERQRLALARAWATKPRLLMLDEPTAALDPTATEAVEQIIQKINADGTRIVMTTHNMGQALRLAKEIIFVHYGQVREQSPSTQFFEEPQSEEARLFLKGELPWRVGFND